MCQSDISSHDDILVIDFLHLPMDMTVLQRTELRMRVFFEDAPSKYGSIATHTPG